MKVTDMAQKIAEGSAELWSIGPFDRPSRAMKKTAPWLRAMEDKYGEGRNIGYVENVRLHPIGRTWWIEVQFDTDSVIAPATERELESTE